ncbi:MAG: hypothetical protein ACFFDR_13015, partial [Candidatus Thorarchaeota archaeon]
ATGSGSMMEENSETVALSVTPLIFSLRDEMLASENLELLSLEWDLERTQSQEVLPEHLIIAGGKSGDVASHVCALSWETGVIDPFRMDSYIATIAKKLSDIEKSIIGNELDYEVEGINVLRRFSDRLNNVTFVEMLDRQFQETWETQKLKPENVDIETILKYEFRDDYSANPPGPRLQRRKSADFNLPEGNENALLLHLQNRIISPKGLDAIASRVPDMGRDILSELNEYAFSIEEVDIARATIAALTSFIGKDEVRPAELNDLSIKAAEFTEKMSEVAEVYSDVLEKHSTSGARLALNDHEQTLKNHIEDHSSSLDALQIGFAKSLLGHMMTSIRREFPISGEIRAWELKASFSYFAAFTKRVLGYIANDLQQFLLINSVKKVMRETLQEFRKEGEEQSSNSTELLLFQKFYSELYSLLNAIIDRISFEGIQRKEVESVIEDITGEISDEFKKIDVWDLIDFNDLAEIARAEIRNRVESPEAKVTAESLIALLSEFERFVGETLPDVGDTFLSKKSLRSVINTIAETGINLHQTLTKIVENETEKPDEWRKEAFLWIDQLSTLIDESMPLSEQIFTFIKLGYLQLGEGATPEAVLERTREEAKDLESEYNEVVSEWKDKCSVIEQENHPIRENNEKRSAKLNEAVVLFEQEMKQYTEAFETHKQLLAAYQLEADSTDSTPPAPPKKPESLEERKARIEKEIPLLQEKPKPPKPEPSEKILTYIELRDLLDKEFERMKRSQERMEQVFTLKLRALKSEGARITEEITIGISSEFLEYLMNAAIRKLGRLLPRAKRAYLRDPEDSSLVYLVNYEFKGSILTVSIGNNLLRREQ